jgi:hypothetical protein
MMLDSRRRPSKCSAAVQSGLVTRWRHRRRPRSRTRRRRRAAGKQGAPRGGGANTQPRPGAGLRGFDVTVARWSGRHETIEELPRGLRHLLHGPGERRRVRPRGAGEAAQLADELEGRGADFLVSGRRSEIVQGPDVSTHARSSSPSRDPLRSRGCPSPIQPRGDGGPSPLPLEASHGVVTSAPGVSINPPPAGRARCYALSSPHTEGTRTCTRPISTKA